MKLLHVESNFDFLGFNYTHLKFGTGQFFQAAGNGKSRVSSDVLSTLDEKYPHVDVSSESSD